MNLLSSIFRFQTFILFIEQQKKALKKFDPWTWCTKKTFRLWSHTPRVQFNVLFMTKFKGED